MAMTRTPVGQDGLGAGVFLEDLVLRLACSAASPIFVSSECFRFTFIYYYRCKFWGSLQIHLQFAILIHIIDGAYHERCIDVMMFCLCRSY